MPQDQVPDHQPGEGSDGAAAPLSPDILPELRALVVGLGASMGAAGDSVDSISATLRRILAAYRVSDVQIMVLPTTLLVQTGHGSGSHVELGSQLGKDLRFDQIAALYSLVDAAEEAAVEPAEGLRRLAAIDRMKPTFGWPTRTFGHAVLTVGLALLLQPSPAAVVAAFVLGLLLGLLKLPRLTTLELVFPVAAAFVVSTIVFAVAQHVTIDNPVRVLLPPLVTFLPGGMLTIGTMELAASQMISGASRLVSGFVRLGLLAFGILAAAALVGVPADVLIDNPTYRLGWWAPWLGVIVFAVGNYLHFSAPARSLPWILLVLVTAYGGQAIGGAVFDGQLSGFFGALAMTPVVLWVESRRNGPPKLITFLPAFWLLVPGAAGLIGVTEIVGVTGSAGADTFREALVTIMSIALGVLIGTALFSTADAGVRMLPNPFVQAEE